MRGIVYRRGKRRSGSVVLVMAAVLAVALSAAAIATAKAPHRSTARAAHWGAKAPKVMAHGAGHKIA